MGIIKSYGCAIPPLYDPPLKDFFKDVEMDFCKGNFCFISCLPTFQGLKIPDILKVLMEALLELVEKLLVAMIIKIITAIIKMLLDALCKALEALGALISGAVTGDFREAFKGAFCDIEMSDEDIDQTAVAMMAALNGCDPEVLQMYASEFISDLTLILTDQELVDLMNGDAGDTTLSKIVEVASLKYPDTFGSCDGFSNKSGTAQTFEAMGLVVPAKYKTLTNPKCMPLMPSLCEPTALQEWEDLQCALLQENKGLTAEQCKEQLDSLRDRIKDDVSQLACLANNGLPDLPPLISDDPCALALLPATDPSSDDLISDVTKNMFNTMSRLHDADLRAGGGTNGGMFNMILSNKRGRAFQSHLNQIMDERSNQFPERVAGYLQDTYFETGDFVPGNFSTTSGHTTASPVWGVDSPKTFRVSDVDLNTTDLSTYGYASLMYPLSALDGYASYRGMGQPITISGELPPESMKNPDLTMKYEDYLDEYSFDMDYHNFQIVDNVSVLNDYYKIKIKETANTSDGDYVSWSGMSGENMTESEVRSLISEAEQGSMNLDIDEYLADKQSPKNSIYAKYVIETISEMTGVSSNSLSGLFDGYYGHYDTLFEMVLKSFAKRLADPSNRGFIHGFPTDYSMVDEDGGFLDLFEPPSSFPEPQKVYLDQTYKNIYTGESQPIPPEVYGGTAENPAFYLLPAKLSGVAGIYRSFVPRPTGCDPQNSPACNFAQLSELYDNYYKKFPGDPRLQEESPCTSEPPWNKILDKPSSAGIEVMIRAIVRIYAVEAIITGLPAFSVFETKIPEVFDECLTDYVIDMIEEGLLATRPKGFNMFLHVRPNKFYFSFMEQAIQAFGHRVDLGEIEPTVEEQDAIDRLNVLQDKWTNNIAPVISKTAWPGQISMGIMAAVSSPFDPSGLLSGPLLGDKTAEIAAENMKKRWWYAFVGNDQALKDARILLRRYVKDEMSFILDGLKEDLKPEISGVHNVFLVNDEFMLGSLGSGGPADVARQSSPGSPDLSSSNLEKAVAKRLGYGSAAEAGPAIEQFFNQPPEEGGYVPFILERYVRIIDQNTLADRAPGAPVTIMSEYMQSLTDEQKDIISRVDIPKLQDFINFDDFKDYIQDGSAFFEGRSVGDFWEGLEFGIRISQVASSTSDDFDELGELSSKLQSANEDNILKNKAFKIGANWSLIPLAWSSRAIEGVEELTLDQIADSLDAYYDRDIDCLVADLIETPGYKLLFDYAISMKRMVSLMTIYTMKSYVASIGSEDSDDWNKDGGNFIWFNTGFKYWDRKSHFERSKRLSRKMFLTYYNATNPGFKADDDRPSHQPSADDSNSPSGLSWLLFNMRRYRPFDSEGNPCALKEED